MLELPFTKQQNNKKMSHAVFVCDRSGLHGSNGANGRPGGSGASGNVCSI